MNFYENYYSEFRGDLVRYAWRFDRSMDTAEDLFEDSHMAICEEYAVLVAVEYLKLMKTAIKHRFWNLCRSVKCLEKSGKASSLCPKTPLAIDEQIFRRSEMTLVMITLNHFNKADRDCLLADTFHQKRQDIARKNRLKVKFLRSIRKEEQERQKLISPRELIQELAKANHLTLKELDRILYREDAKWICAPSDLSLMMKGEAHLTKDLSIRLGAYFHKPSFFFSNLESEYDVFLQKYPQ